MKTVVGLVATGLLLGPLSGNAVPVSFGALSSDDDGSTAIITDSLNNMEWLRWDVADLTLADTLAAISAGGLYEGWQIARNAQAQLFTNALLFGLDNACTDTGSDTCNVLLPNTLTGLLGDSSFGSNDQVVFLSNDGLDAGYMEYQHEGSFGSLIKFNDLTPVEGFDFAGDNIGWLLFRTESPPPTSVPEPGTLALFGLGLAGVGAIRRRRVAST